MSTNVQLEAISVHNIVITQLAHITVRVRMDTYLEPIGERVTVSVYANALLYSVLRGLIIVANVTPTDRPESVRNRCVIEVFGGVFVL